MLLSKKILMVLPNPFAAPLDANGFPCGFIMHDPEHPVAAKHIGAKVTYKPLDPKARIDPRGGQQQRLEATVTYSFEPCKIVDTAYHRRLLKADDILPADAATAKAAGFKAADFVAPEIRLRKLATAAIETWTREHDEEEPPVAEWSKRGVSADGPLVPVVAADGGV
jgi:hypothetical protein